MLFSGLWRSISGNRSRLVRRQDHSGLNSTSGRRRRPTSATPVVLINSLLDVGSGLVSVLKNSFYILGSNSGGRPFEPGLKSINHATRRTPDKLLTVRLARIIGLPSFLTARHD